MDLEGDRKLVPLLNSPAAERGGKISPDGKWLAYVSDESGSAELYVTSFPVTGSKWQISNGGISGGSGDWSADGKNYRFQQGDKIYNVEVRNNGAKPEFSAPKELLTLPPNVIVVSILPDGKRILAARPTGDQTSVPLDFVLNWQHLVQ
jgi:hypothetical protein